MNEHEKNLKKIVEEKNFELKKKLTTTLEEKFLNKSKVLQQHINELKLKTKQQKSSNNNL